MYAAWRRVLAEPRASITTVARRARAESGKQGAS